MGIAWHAPYDLLKPETQDLARAIQSLMEELEAIDWYGQRMDVTQDDQLRAVLEHNRDEEKEHAAMILEWIRRRDPQFDEALRTYLFTSGDLLTLEHHATQMEVAENAGASSASPSPPADLVVDGAPALTVGSLRGNR